MKTAILVLFLVALSFSSVAQAQHHAFVEIQSGTPEFQEGLTVSGGLSYALPEQFAITSFLLVKGGWAEALLGATWSPYSWMTFGASVGGSQASGQLDFRTGYMLFLKHQQFSFLGILEVPREAYSGNHVGIWYDLNLMYQPLEWLVVGIKDRRPLGMGPMVRFRISPIELWMTWSPLSAESGVFQPKSAQFGVKLGF